MRKVCLKNGKNVFCGILLQCKPNPAQRFFLSHKRMCLGTFSRRGAVALATIYPCAECASSRSIFIVWKRSFLYDKNALCGSAPKAQDLLFLFYWQALQLHQYEHIVDRANGVFEIPVAHADDDV